MKFMQIFKMPNIFVHDRIIEKYFFVSCKTNVDDDWEVHIVHPDNRYFLFLKSQKISVNLGCFYVVLMILFLSACLLSSLDAVFFFAKTGDLESWHLFFSLNSSDLCRA